MEVVVVRRILSAWDKELFLNVATRSWPAAEPVLPRLSRAANHGLLWFGVAAGIAAVGGRTGRRAALRGAGSLAVASAVVNTIGKGAVRRNRPVLDAVPVIRRLSRQPGTTSFPSGHAASAAAFAAGVALESPRWGAAVLPVAWSVAFSRIYTGVHYPSDVAVGMALGAGAALAVRGLVPTGRQLAVPPTPRADAPALPDGRGLFAVVNEVSGPPPLLGPPAERLRGALPEAVVEECSEDDDLAEMLEKAAQQAAEAGGALGIHGGDGSVSLAASVALRHGVPLLVSPGGTYNHFALDLSIESIDDAVRAVREGTAIAVDVARVTPTGAAAGKEAGAAESTVFLNTFSIGVYPDLVRYRERWSRRVGSWPAGVLAALHVLRTSAPIDLEINGRRHSVWMLFAGNGAYRSIGPAPLRRRALSDGQLDVRIVPGSPYARTRLLAAALTGSTTALLRRMRIGGVEPGTRLAFDGEVAPAPRELVIDKANEALTVYRPL
ncbi:phosphatase PAP2 family protein [Actinacidiphila glaucinigra]|uniref:bifunctional phosphatase PAP2/diacylglycerol kinase family protein n=1 Tax=Actinacidiphila glaucinigra TaxID=235986 RepID=UPI0033A521AF